MDRPGLSVSRRLVLGGGIALGLGAAAYTMSSFGDAVEVTGEGAVGDGVTDDTVAIRRAINRALVEGRPLRVPVGRYLVDAPLLIVNVVGFRLVMDGVFVRKAGSAAMPLLTFVRCHDLKCESIRIDGNVQGNMSAGANGQLVPFDEVRHSLRLDDCEDVQIGVVEAIDPPGDAVYLAGGAASNRRLFIGEVTATSTSRSGRNAVSIIAGQQIEIGKVVARGIGYPNGSVPMPGGFLIEPNEGDEVRNVVVGSLDVSTAGATGFGLVGNAPRQIQDVQVEDVYVSKLVGSPAGGCDVNIRGVDGLTVGRLHVERHESVGSQVMAISDSVNVAVDIVSHGLGRSGVTIGEAGGVESLTLTGSLSKADGNLLELHSVTNSSFNMKLTDPGPNGGCISKMAGGVSQNVEISGDLSRGTSGAYAIGGVGEVSDWRLKDLDLSGWPPGSDCRFLADGSAKVV